MPEGEKRSAKLAVVETLLEHEVPPFDEYDPWWPGGAVAGPTHRRLTEMKGRLKLLLMSRILRPFAGLMPEARGIPQRCAIDPEPRALSAPATIATLREHAGRVAAILSRESAIS